MYCQNCGALNEDNAVYCGTCGTRLQPQQPEAGQPYQTAQESQAGQQSQMGQQPQQDGWGYQQPYGQPQTAVMPAKKQVSGLLIAVIAEVLVLVCLIYAAFSIGKKGFGEEHMAESYFVNMVNGEWKDAYQKLDVEETEFINAEMFAAANQDNYFGIVNGYTVQKQKASDLYSLLDGGSSGLGTQVTVTYRVKGDLSDETYDLTVNKQPKKKLLMFENWKIGADNFMCRNYYVSVPKGASVSIDGVALSEKYRTTQTDEWYENMDQYVIPQLFQGTHKILVTKDGWKDEERSVSADSLNTEFYLESMQLKEETLQQLIQTAGTNMQQIYNAVLQGKNLKAVESMFTKNEEDKSYIQDSYDSLLAAMNEGTDYMPYRIEFSNMKGYCSGTAVTLEFDYDIYYQYEDWWTGNLDYDVSDGEGEYTFYFTQEDGNWVMTNLGCGSLYW